MIIYFLALRIIAIYDRTPYSEKTLIVDDTVVSKSGYIYKGKQYALKQLWPIVKKQTQWLGKFQVSDNNLILLMN